MSQIHINKHICDTNMESNDNKNSNDNKKVIRAFATKILSCT